MANRISNLSSTLILNTKQFSTGLNQATTDTRRFSDATEKTARVGGEALKATRRHGMMLQQLAFAAEDAAVSYGIGGFAGAVRAAGNNISQFAMLMNPMAGIVTTFGVAIGAAVLPPLAKWLTATEDLEEAHKAFNEQLDGTHQKLQEQIDQREELAKAGKEPNAFEERMKAFGVDANAANLRSGRINTQLVLEQKKLDDLLLRQRLDREMRADPELGRNRPVPFFDDTNEKIKAAQDRVRELQQQKFNEQVARETAQAGQAGLRGAFGGGFSGQGIGGLATGGAGAGTTKPPLRVEPRLAPNAIESLIKQNEEAAREQDRINKEGNLKLGEIIRLNRQQLEAIKGTGASGGKSTTKVVHF